MTSGTDVDEDSLPDLTDFPPDLEVEVSHGLSVPFEGPSDLEKWIPDQDYGYTVYFQEPKG